MRRILIVASGQSNIMGGTGGEGGDQTANANVKIWQPSLSAWAVAALGIEPFPVTDPIRNNLVFNFAKKLQETHDCEVYIVLSGQGNTPISEWEAPSGQQWIDLDTAATDALASTELTGKPYPDYFLWFQGEADPYNADYKADFLALRQAAITSGWLAHDTPVIAGETFADNSLSKAALFELLGDRDATWFNIAPNEGMERAGTGPHFTAQGYIDYGRGPFFAASLQTPRLVAPYFKAWTPTLTGSTSAPTVNYDTSVTQGGSYRVGNVVFAWFTIKLTALWGGSGHVLINGFPYPLNASIPGGGNYMQTGVAADVTGLVEAGGPILFKSAGPYGVRLLRANDAGTVPLYIAKINGDFTMIGSLTYFVN